MTKGTGETKGDVEKICGAADERTGMETGTIGRSLVTVLSKYVAGVRVYVRMCVEGTSAYLLKR